MRDIIFGDIYGSEILILNLIRFDDDAKTVKIIKLRAKLTDSFDMCFVLPFF